jgi:hypothetical protein
MLDYSRILCFARLYDLVAVTNIYAAQGSNLMNRGAQSIGLCSSSFSDVIKEYTMSLGHARLPRRAQRVKSITAYNSRI